MSRSRFSLLTDADLSSVHEASLTILRNTGILLQHPDVVQMLASAGASVESAHPIVHLPETLVLDSVILYGGIPHIMDPRTTLCSFGAPEQGVMAAGMAQLGRYYGFPVYINVGLTDAKALDLQAGMEKGATLAWGALAGAELFGHAGIRGADHGASLLWLCADNEMMAYVKRLARGVEVSPDTLAADVVHAVQPGGNFLAEKHTVKHLRRELWLPGAAWTRQAFGAWETDGGKSMTERLRSEMQCLLKSHRPPPSHRSWRKHWIKSSLAQKPRSAESVGSFDRYKVGGTEVDSPNIHEAGFQSNPPRFGPSVRWAACPKNTRRDGRQLSFSIQEESKPL